MGNLRKTVDEYTDLVTRENRVEELEKVKTHVFGLVKDTGLKDLGAETYDQYLRLCHLAGMVAGKIVGLEKASAVGQAVNRIFPADDEPEPA